MLELILAIPLLIIPLFWPVVTGLMAISFGRKFWTWFFIGIPLPFAGCIILLCLPDKRKKGQKMPFEETIKNENHAISIQAEAQRRTA
jgi:hypothetical protein